MRKHDHLHENFGGCQELLTSLSEYVDGDLSPDLCSILEMHLKSCSRCRIVLDTLRKTIELYHETAEETQLPADVRSRLLMRLNLEDYSEK
jgi:anti-sigma factor (TIGR02949 family)